MELSGLAVDRPAGGKVVERRINLDLPRLLLQSGVSPRLSQPTYDRADAV